YSIPFVLFTSVFHIYSPTVSRRTPMVPCAAALPLLTGKGAFTVIELLIVMAIIGVVAVLLLPALGTGAGRSVDGASRQFAADLERARLLAMAERTRTRVLF